MQTRILVMTATVILAGTAAHAELPNDRWKYESGGDPVVSDWEVTDRVVSDEGIEIYETYERTRTTPGQQAVNPGGQVVKRFNTEDSVETQRTTRGGRARPPSNDVPFGELPPPSDCMDWRNGC